MSGATEDVTRVEGAASVPLDELSASASFDASAIARIDRLGRYVLIDLLGRGAFGAVWSAYDPKLDRKVAIKVVHARRGAVESAAQAELLREAQLLAQLSHPNVVAIHDVGTLEEVLAPADAATSLIGVFIVMEHLSGPTLSEWLAGDEPATQHPSQSFPLGEPRVGASRASVGVPRSSALASRSGLGVLRSSDGASGSVSSLASGVREQLRADEHILQVFAEAGRGLQAAHARDLVHLDFKPGNVMFGADGRVRVLDFGLAQVGAGERERDASKARVAGTPAYMAPEQHEGKRADARADQYAFCLSLWEALAGQRPFAGDSPKDVYVAKLGGPPRPSPGMLRSPHVHAVLERGLAVDPAQRFASMAELLARLEDDPRVRRRRWLGGVALVGGLLAAGFGLARASSPNPTVADPCALPDGQFEGIWDAARRSQVEAAFAATKIPYAGETFAQVAIELDDQILRWSAVRREVCRATLVDASSSVEQMSEELLCLDRQLRSVAGVSAALLEADAEIVARAHDSVRELDDPAACHGVDDGSEGVVGGARRALLLELEDALARARVARELGRFSVALEAADQAIAGARELEDPSSHARGLRERSVALRELGRADEAVAASMQALTQVTTAGDATLETQILIELVAAHTISGEFNKALTVAELVQARIDPPTQPKLAMRAYLRAAASHERQHHWDEALAQLDAALALADAHPDIEPALVAELHINYGNILMGSGRDAVRGELEYREAIRGFEAALGAHHPSVARARMNLGTAYFRRGDYRQAIALFNAALAEFEQIYPADHPLISACHQNLGAANSVRGDLQAALRHTRQSLTAAEAKLGRAHPDYASIERNLGSIMMLLGDYRGAYELFHDAESVYRASLEPGHSRRLALDAELAECGWWLGELEQAQARAVEIEQALASTEAGDPRRIGPLSTLATFSLHAHDYATAERYASESLALGVAVLGLDNPDIARARTLLAEIYRASGQLERAATELEQAMAIVGKPGDEHVFVVGVLLELGRLARARGQGERAREQLERALGLAAGPNGSAVNVALINLERAALLDAADPAQAAALRASARASLRERGVRPEL